MAVTIDGTNGITSPDFEPSSSTTPTNGLFLPTTNALGFATNSTERLRLDASGNLGLGISSPLAKANIVSAGAALGGTAQLAIGASSNNYDNTYLRIDNSGNSNFCLDQILGGVSYNRLFIERTTGNVGIGTTSPGARLDVYGSGNVSINSKGNLFVSPGGTAAQSSGAGGQISFGAWLGGDLGAPYAMAAIKGVSESSTTNTNTGALIFATAPQSTVLTERARIDSSGNLLVGTTSANAILTTKALNNNASTFALYCMNSSSTQLFKVRDDGLIETGTATNSPYNYTTGSSANTFVNSSGQFQRSTSSARYKNSITDAVHGLAEVLKLRPVTYKGNNDGDTVFGGLIAEEVHDAGLTEFVQYNDDGEPDALAYGNMVSLAFKAIQELTARLEALENK